MKEKLYKRLFLWCFLYIINWGNGVKNMGTEIIFAIAYSILLYLCILEIKKRKKL